VIPYRFCRSGESAADRVSVAERSPEVTLQSLPGVKRRVAIRLRPTPFVAGIAPADCRATHGNVIQSNFLVAVLIPAF
jgi:hypothetical protein